MRSASMRWRTCARGASIGADPPEWGCPSSIVHRRCSLEPNSWTMVPVAPVLRFSPTDGSESGSRHARSMAASGVRRLLA